MTTGPQALTAGDVQVLRMLNRFRFLTAAQLNRLLWPNNTKDRNPHAQRQLHKLAQDEYALVVGQLPTPNTPTASLVYTVGWRGRKALLAAGERVPRTTALRTRRGSRQPLVHASHPGGC
jgi:hypothetical protein